MILIGYKKMEETDNQNKKNKGKRKFSRMNEGDLISNSVYINFFYIIINIKRIIYSHTTMTGTF